MSHGSDGKINGTDHVPVRLEEITDKLKGGTLVDKPKMFFIQACRATMRGKILLLVMEVINQKALRAIAFQMKPTSSSVMLLTRSCSFPQL